MRTGAEMALRIFCFLSVSYIILGTEAHSQSLAAAFSELYLLRLPPVQLSSAAFGDRVITIIRYKLGAEEIHTACLPHKGTTQKKESIQHSQ